MLRSFFFILLFLSITAAAQQNINLSRPPAMPQLFSPGIISTGLGERDFAISPDGKVILYTLQSPQGMFQTILEIKKQPDGSWSKPVIASFAGKYSDLEPAFSADGKKLFFSSNRPLSGTEIKDFDIWVVEKDNGKWGEPKNIGAPVNTAEDEFYPSAAKNGNLYFTAAYKNAVRRQNCGYFCSALGVANLNRAAVCSGNFHGRSVPVLLRKPLGQELEARLNLQFAMSEHVCAPDLHSAF